jgi:hypothetical protein
VIFLSVNISGSEINLLSSSQQSVLALLKKKMSVTTAAHSITYGQSNVLRDHISCQCQDRLKC